MPWRSLILDSEYVPRQIESEMQSAVDRALAAGAKPPLTYIGAGMTGIVFCTSKGAFKVARSSSRGRFLEDEAEWLFAAHRTPIAPYVARIRSYDPDLGVIHRACPMPDPDRRRTPEGELWELHYKVLGPVMLDAGWTMPEFKWDSWITTKKGPILVDASMPGRAGKVLLKYAKDVLQGRRHAHESSQDIAFAIRMEIGRTLTAAQAAPLLRKLHSAS